MPQIINEEPGLGYRLGTGLGSGLSSALNNLTNLKFQELASRNQQMAQSRQRAESSALLQKFGLSPEASDYVSTLPAKEQWAAVQELSGIGALGELQQQQAPDSMAHLEPQPQETSRPLSSVLGDLGGGQAPRSVMDLLALPRQQMLPEQPMQQQAPMAQPASPVQQQQQAAVQPSQQAQQLKPEAPVSKPLTKQQVKNPINPAEKLALKKQLQLQKDAEKELRINQKDINKETEDFYKTTLKAGEGAKKSDMRLNRMEELVKKGSLPISHFYRLFKSLSEAEFGKTGSLIGGFVGAILDPLAHAVGGGALALQRGLTATDTEEFEKLSTDFIREAKEIFGARVTDADLRAFMQIIPTLSQTDAGKLRIIENMRAFNEANLIKANAMKEIIKANGGRRPANLDLLVDEYTKPELDQLAREFKEGRVTTTKAPVAKSVAAPVQTRKGIPSVIGSARKRAGLQ